LYVGVLTGDGGDGHLARAAIISYFLIHDGLAAGVSLSTGEELDVLGTSSKAGHGNDQPCPAAAQGTVWVHARDIPTNPIFGVTTRIRDKVEDAGRIIQRDIQRIIKIGILRCLLG
jgi:hypothetical protein